MYLFRAEENILHDSHPRKVFYRDCFLGGGNHKFANLSCPMIQAQMYTYQLHALLYLRWTKYLTIADKSWACTNSSHVTINRRYPNLAALFIRCHRWRYVRQTSLIERKCASVPWNFDRGFTDTCSSWVLWKTADNLHKQKSTANSIF